MPRPRVPTSPFRYFNSSPEVIRLAVLLHVKYPLSLRNVEDLLAERGIDIIHDKVRMPTQAERSRRTHQSQTSANRRKVRVGLTAPLGLLEGTPLESVSLQILSQTIGIVG